MTKQTFCNRPAAVSATYRCVMLPRWHALTRNSAPLLVSDNLFPPPSNDTSYNTTTAFDSHSQQDQDIPPPPPHTQSLQDCTDFPCYEYMYYRDRPPFSEKTCLTLDH